MNKKLFLFIGLFVAISFLITGCGKSTAEKAIETATNGDASVDVDNNQVTININGSSYQAGGDIELPDGFPSDVYVVNGIITTSYTYEVDRSYSIGILTDKNQSELKSLYEEQMKDKGWSIEATANTADIVTVSFKKTDERRANVNITKDVVTDKWLVTITTQDTTDTNTNSTETEE